MNWRATSSKWYGDGDAAKGKFSDYGNNQQGVRLLYPDGSGGPCAGGFSRQSTLMV